MARFEAYREHCFGLAYRMLGSVADAEDLVQECWLRFERCASELEQPRGWLTRVVTRLAIDRLRELRRRREEYVGPWLPAPLVAEPEQVESLAAAESVAMAFMVVLEELGPVERAVFLLRAVFDHDYETIAGIVGKSVANCRQIHFRARRRLDERKPRFAVDVKQHLAMLEAFADATRRNDVEALMSMLHPESRMTSDGGGKVAAALRPLCGPEKIARFFLGVSRLHGASRVVTWEPCVVNARAGAIVRLDGEVDSVMSVDVAGRILVGIHIVRNPDKLQHIASDSEFV